jgi:hypothetical protein
VALHRPPGMPRVPRTLHYDVSEVS